MLRIVQIINDAGIRAVAVAEGDRLKLLGGVASTYDLAQEAIESGKTLTQLARTRLSDETLDYDPIYDGQSDWQLLPCIDHPTQPGCCLITGTGLTHKASADNRAAMHKNADNLSDSMKMYLWGVEGGSPGAGKIGVQPEWFYKGAGSILRAHGQALPVPAFADDGGEEPEVAGIYLIANDGTPYRIGMATGNEFADHVMEKKNYLYLAPSKLRACALGPELIVDPDFGDVKGQVKIERDGVDVWSKQIATGEANMCHTVANMEHHQFKYDQHRQGGDVHIHFFGADAFSFGEGFSLVDGDIMQVAWEGFGRPLRNPIAIDDAEQPLVQVKSL